MVWARHPASVKALTAFNIQHDIQISFEPAPDKGFSHF
ncbi:hypothetical protein LHK_02478 [Laribacter hongkongensis HLHK9]|uniref:Uncharacterized protein n=1 Tax=Laribacter hongkongensis (strain HLHK9) TaxID=557598 RepID=C1DBQ7_LARHH|nr:hypothetical protein LHK_02478 [Laribacter hongkongensis HLHK9]